MISYITNPLPAVHAISADLVFIAIVLTTAIACIDPVGGFLWRLYQERRVARWDANKARRHAINMARSEAIYLPDNHDRAGVVYAPEPLTASQRDQSGRQAVYRARYAGRKYS